METLALHSWGAYPTHSTQEGTEHDSSPSQRATSTGMGQQEATAQKKEATAPVRGKLVPVHPKEKKNKSSLYSLEKKNKYGDYNLLLYDVASRRSCS